VSFVIFVAQIFVASVAEVFVAFVY